MNEPKILTLDIETSPLKVYTWSLWDERTGVNQIDLEWSILAVCAKWLDGKPMYKDCRNRPKGPRDDAHLLKWVHELLDEADIVVSQNGISFDTKKINARLIAEGYRPYAPIRQIDTKVIAGRHFAFTSNRLEWLGKNIAKTAKSDHRKFPGFELWAACLADKPAAWSEMKKYNVQDVVATEQLYMKLRPWMEGHPNLATYGDKEVPSCPRCRGTQMNRRGTAVTQAGRYPRYQCQDCGGWARGKKTELPAKLNRGLLVQ
jgi:RNase_H superfamily